MEKTFYGRRIAKLRMAKNISARKLSMELGQGTEYINQIENNRCMPSLEGLSNICEYFNISLSDFFDETTEYPIEYKEIIEELNKLDKIELEQITKTIKLITSNRTKTDSKQKKC